MPILEVYQQNIVRLFFIGQNTFQSQILILHMHLINNSQYVMELKQIYTGNQMIPVETSKKLSKKQLSKSSKFGSGQKQALFLRSYSELISSHFIQSNKEKSSLRKRTQSYRGLKQKTASQKLCESKDKFQVSKRQQNKPNNQDTFEQSLNQNRRNSENKFNSSQILRRSTYSVFKLQSNPQSDDKMQLILVSKTPQIQKNSYQNVILSKRLYQNTVQKNDLFNSIQTLKLQILKQKKKKTKASTKMAKLMNKIEQINSLTRKIRDERNFISQQTQTVNKEVNSLTEKNKQLELMSSTNYERINTEKQLIERLQRSIQTQKISLYQTKVYYNELKSIYMQQSKCMTNNQLNFNQILSEREKFVQVVQNSVTMTKPTSKN